MPSKMKNVLPFKAEGSLLTGEDLHYFNEGRHFRLYEKMGAHMLPQGGAHFSVWAPGARQVSVIGDFNHWDARQNYLSPMGSSGVWSGKVSSAGPGQAYKYHIVSSSGHVSEKADPVAFCTETPPKTASVLRALEHEWQDDGWMKMRGERQRLDKPMSIYEVHLGSWRHKVEDYSRPLTYDELAEQLVPYVRDLGFTHVELMPVMEHPFGGSWGYQITGFFAPTRRFGDPEGLMRLVDAFHQAGIGVILDWVPSHFPDDAHGLNYFGGSHLYEHADPRQGFHPDWHSMIFNYGRKEVRSFLISSAMFWLDKYHIDGLRVDAVASMLYLDYSRKAGEWIPNARGGRENTEAITFMQEMNTELYRAFPDVQIIAEESTAWPGVTKPANAEGLGYGLKWDMGWMHDSLRFFKRDTVHRRYHMNDLSFRGLYAFHENFLLPLSHDEVVHGKGSLLGKMPGDVWQKFANLRCLLFHMYAQPGKKLLFMGGEFGQWNEWNHNISLDWHLLDSDAHRQIQQTVRDLNLNYSAVSALQLDCDPGGFEWLSMDNDNSVMAYLRRNGDDVVLCVLNATPAPCHNYRVGVPSGGEWKEIFNSDAKEYGGSGMGNAGGVTADAVSSHGKDHSLSLTLPPLSGMMLRCKA